MPLIVEWNASANRFYLLKNLLLLILVIFKLKCNNLILNKIMVLNASYVCLHSFPVHRESPDPDPRRRIPYFWGGSVTAGIRARSGLNTQSKTNFNNGMQKQIYITQVTVHEKNMLQKKRQMSKAFCLWGERRCKNDFPLSSMHFILLQPPSRHRSAVRINASFHSQSSAASFTSPRRVASVAQSYTEEPSPRVVRCKCHKVKCKVRWRCLLCMAVAYTASDMHSTFCICKMQWLVRVILSI
jgi:hypothetical protein